MKLRAIVCRELGSYFASPLAWVVIAAFLLLSGFYFYGNLYFFIVQGGFDLNRGLWQYQFHDMRYVLLLIAPLVTMRSFAEERRLGTLELLWTYPVSDHTVILGKYVAALTLLVILLAPTAVHPMLVATVYPIDAGPILSGYLGLFLLGAAFLACGLFVSSTTDSQIVAGTVTFALLLLLWAMNWNEAALDETTGAALKAVSLFDRFFSFGRGVVNSSDVTFFLAFIAFFLFLTLLVLELRRWRGVE